MTIPMWCSTSSTVRSNSSRSERMVLAELVDLAVGQAAGGLVEHQQPRTRRRAPGRARCASACRRAGPAAGSWATSRQTQARSSTSMASARS